MDFGVQLWTLRTALKEDFSGTLEKLAESRTFDGLEFAFNYGGLTPSELAAFTKKIKLGTSGLFDYMKNFVDPESEVYSYASALKCKYLISSFNQKDLDADIDNCLAILEQACFTAEKKGLTLCYHGHPFDYVEKNTSGSYMDRILEIPSVKLVPDTGWITHARRNLMEFLEQNAARIPIIHLKDTKEDDSITELGNGIVDLPAVFDFAAAADVKWLNYEQDDNFSISSLDSCIKSYEYVRRRFLKTS